MSRPVPGVSQLAPCPLRSNPDVPLKHLAWKDATGWVVAYGTPKVWTLVAAGLPCWHMAMDAAARVWLPPEVTAAGAWSGAGWSTPSFRLNDGLELPDGQLVCDACHADLTGAAR